MDYFDWLETLHVEKGIAYTAIAALVGVTERSVRGWAEGEYAPSATHAHRLRVLCALDRMRAPDPSTGYGRYR